MKVLSVKFLLRLAFFVLLAVLLYVVISPALTKNGSEGFNQFINFDLAPLTISTASNTKNCDDGGSHC